MASRITAAKAATSGLGLAPKAGRLATRAIGMRIRRIAGPSGPS